MADLNQADKDRMKKSTFGLPESRKYPMPDAEHARLAEGFATRLEHEGKLSHTDAQRVRRKAHKVLGD